ncbi:hypothetical protein LTR85_002497 [Meristemomyces frigidus]|nr:hypothetical protein LTR85_002497 [Meristemomyces frigidus]
MVMAPTSVLMQMPPDFWEQLNRCRDLAQRSKEHEEATAALIRERQQHIDNADVAFAHGMLQATWQQDRRKPAIDVGRDSSKELFAFAKRQQKLDAGLREAFREQVEAQQGLHTLAEDQLIAKKILPARETGPENSRQQRPAQKAAAPKASVKKQHDGTPQYKSLRDAPPLSDDTAFAVDLRGKLSGVIKTQLTNTRKRLAICEKRLDGMHNEPHFARPGQSLAAQEKLSQEYSLEKSKRTRELIDAEAAFLHALRQAREAGLEGVEAKSHGFSSHASNGYLQSDVRAQLSRADHGALERWMADAEKAEAPGFGEDAGQEQDGPYDIPTMMALTATGSEAGSLVLGESFSTVTVGKDRANIDKVASEWLLDGDGFQRNRRDTA